MERGADNEPFPARLSTAAGSLGTRTAAIPWRRPAAKTRPAMVGCRCQCLWQSTWSRRKPVAAKAANCAAISAATCRRSFASKKIRTLAATMSLRKLPARSTRSGTSSAGDTGRPSIKMTWRPTRSVGSRDARATASAAAGAPIIRLAAVKMPLRWAISTASLTSGAKPKSSAVTIKSFSLPILFSWCAKRLAKSRFEPVRLYNPGLGSHAVTMATPLNRVAEKTGDKDRKRQRVAHRPEPEEPTLAMKHAVDLKLKDIAASRSGGDDNEGGQCHPAHQGTQNGQWQRVRDRQAGITGRIDGPQRPGPAQLVNE